MGVKLVSSSAGSVELVAPVTASNYTATMPAKTGTVMIDGPAFSAYSGSAQSISSGTFTKIQCNTEEFDTNSNYDNATNYRFTPTVAGYYQVSGAFNPQVTGGLLIAAIYKNGTRFKDFSAFAASSGGGLVNGTALIYLNGSTDYVEFYGYQASGSSASITTSANGTYFQASMVRGA